MPGVIFCTDRRQWREWLSRHFETEQEIWFVFPSADSGETGVSYNDAVEEALCFGWIDGRAGTLDETHQLRRFTPRRKGSGYSQPNIERLIWLDSQGLIHPKVSASRVAQSIRSRAISLLLLFSWYSVSTRSASGIWAALLSSAIRR